MRILILLTAACLALAAPGRAADSVDMTLVLVSDVSRSVDDAEFKLQKEGYIEAFTSRQVIEAIRGGSIGAIGALLSIGGNYPWWSLGIFFLCCWVVYGIAVFGEEDETAPRA